MFNDDRPAIIFVCVHNAGRSQMAAGFLRAAAGDRVRVMSAGTEPKEYVNPVVVAVIQEIGIDISEGFPARLTNDDVVAADLCITMGCGDACPLVPGKTYMDWKVEDPSGQSIDKVRRIRDDIAERVQVLLTEDVVGDGG
ncbi:MAG: hypothetical protein CL790_01410 [Chloroflexi bacterium]|nr:hypothetical protein [Chloroflexota bacterium]HCU73318.1 hypothetical protein [Chloroflexota bacterium]|tara:strand:+ start:9058 stop:9477 length:420 start_codon:yes stop_codon:yes gene_type:complete